MNQDLAKLQQAKVRVDPEFQHWCDLPESDSPYTSEELWAPLPDLDAMAEQHTGIEREITFAHDLEEILGMAGTEARDFAKAACEPPTPPAAPRGLSAGTSLTKRSRAAGKSADALEKGLHGLFGSDPELADFTSWLRKVLTREWGLS